MKCNLYLNRVFYRSIEQKEWTPDIHWAVPLSPPSYIKVGSGFSSEGYELITFRHCGLGHYHCHVSQEKENQIRKRTTKNGS